MAYTTDRLVLRLLEPGDAEALYAFRSLPEVNTYTYTPVWTSMKDAREHVERFVPKYKLGEFGMWVILRRDTQELIGNIFLGKHEELQGTAEIGYMLHPDHAGQGFATEAVRETLRIGFEEFGFHRIYARVDEENAPSARICEKVGMRLEARLVECDRNPMRDNAWSTELNYAMLDREWKALRDE